MKSIGLATASNQRFVFVTDCFYVFLMRLELAGHLLFLYYSGIWPHCQCLSFKAASSLWSCDNAECGNFRHMQIWAQCTIRPTQPFDLLLTDTVNAGIATIRNC